MPTGRVKRLTEWLAIGISVLALGVSAMTAYQQFWPADETKSIVTYTHFSIEEGRFGRGAALTAAISFVNTGNRPLILSKIVASFGYSDTGAPPTNCDTNSGLWTGVPWDTEITADGSWRQAFPKAILPDIPTISVYTFEPIPGQRNRGTKEHARMVCLKYEVINSDGEISEVRSPIGQLVFTDERIQDFVKDKSWMQPLTIVP